MSEKTTENVYEFFINVYEKTASPIQLEKWKEQAKEPITECIEFNREIFLRMRKNLLELKKLPDSPEKVSKISFQKKLMRLKLSEIGRIARGYKKN